MAAKTIPSWQQQPVTATEIQSLHFDRNATNGYAVTAIFERKDGSAVVRSAGSYGTTIANLAAFSGATLLAGINAQEGT